MLARQDIKALIGVAVESSDLMIGGILLQWVNNSWQPLAFSLKRMQDAEFKLVWLQKEGTDLPHELSLTAIKLRIK